MRFIEGRQTIETAFGAGGSAALFDWRENATLEMERSYAFSFYCEGLAAIEGRAWGGFSRQLVLTNGVNYMPLCKYDGVEEEGCQASVESQEVYLRNGTFFVGGDASDEAPSTMIFELGPGWTLANHGQGSTRAVQAFDPQPVVVPAASQNVTVTYVFLGEREKASAAGLSVIGSVMVLGAIGSALSRLGRGRGGYDDFGD